MRKARAILLLMLLPFPTLAQVQTTIAPPALPTLNAQGDQVSDTDAIYCRPPQQRVDSRLMGPKVCMTVRKWNQLHADGFDIGPDGNQVAIPKSLDDLRH